MLMARKYNTNLSRSIAIANYILEDGGHTVLEAAEEFRISKTSVQKDINFLYIEGTIPYSPNSKELLSKYVKVKKTLSRIAKKK